MVRGDGIVEDAAVQVKKLAHSAVVPDLKSGKNLADNADKQDK